MSDKLKADQEFSVKSGFRFAMVPHWLLEMNLSSGAIHMYALLMYHANSETRECYPSHKRLGDLAGCSVTPVKKYIKELKVYKGISKYNKDFIPASTLPDVLPETPSGVAYESLLLEPSDKVKPVPVTLVLISLIASMIEPFAVVDKDDIFAVFDDRQQVVDMWRDNGLTVFQVAQGDF